MARAKSGKSGLWVDPDDGPMRRLLEEALKDFRLALTDRGVYKKGHRDLERACNGARDFVDFLLEGPWALERGRHRPKTT